AHDQRELPAKGIRPFPRSEAKGPGRPAGRIDQARQHLERGRLAGPVGPEERNHFAGFDGEADVGDGVDFLVLAMEEAAQSAAEAGSFLEDAIGFRQSLGLDDWHDSWLSPAGIPDA